MTNVEQIITLKKHAALEINMSAWWNTKQADKTKISTDTADGLTSDKALLHLTKKILECSEYDAIGAHQNRVKARLEAISVSAFHHKAVLLFCEEAITRADAIVKKGQADMLPIIDQFISVYSDKIASAKDRLGNQFDPADYPTEDEVRARFKIRARWTAFEVPEGLPKDIYEQEKQRIQRELSETAESIRDGLRTSFGAWIKNLRTQMEGKKLIEASVDNALSFFTNFNLQNLTDDTVLQGQVEKAKLLLEGTGVEILRDDAGTRSYVAQQFSVIEKAVNGMLENKPKRKFNFGN